jgi:protein-tyrosine phosphatase
MARTRTAGHDHQRTVALDGCLNFRDLGGYPTGDGRTVRWGQVYRSDALHLLTARDVDRLRDELGIADVIDLRSSAELQADGRGRLGDEPIRFHHVPLFDREAVGRVEASSAINLADRYFLLAEFAMRPIAQVIATIAETNGPAVYHCAAGKDRTGVVSAIILGLLGVADEIVVADYAMTQENLDQIIERLLATEGYQSMLAALPPDTLHAEPATMLSLLAKVGARYGSMRGYALAAGVAEATIERLRARLLG